MPPNMPTMNDWLVSSANADKGLELMLFCVFITLSWLAICKLFVPSALPVLAKVLAVVWSVSGFAALVAFLGVK